MAPFNLENGSKCESADGAAVIGICKHHCHRRQ